ncbi:MAG: YidC/Oxa1 family membrane protein insertase [Patescibacteria group bacterium]
MYNTLLVQPLINLLVFFYNLFWHDFGLAVVALTVLIRLLLYPSFKHQLEAQKKLSQLQPQLQVLKEKHKGDREAHAKAQMEFYKTNKVNPFSSCLPLVIQLVILFALYRVFFTGLNGQALQSLYPFITNPGSINHISMGFLDLSKPNLYLALITGVFQFFQSKMMISLQPKPVAGSKNPEDMAANLSASMSKSMLYIFPVMTVWIGATLPAGLALYWLITTVFSIVQQYIIMRDNKKPLTSNN